MSDEGDEHQSSATSPQSEHVREPAASLTSASLVSSWLGGPARGSDDIDDAGRTGPVASESAADTTGLRRRSLDLSALPTPLDRLVRPPSMVVAIALLSAVAAACSGQAPTGTRFVDPVLAAVLGGAVPWLAHRTGGRALLLTGGLLAFFSGLSLPALLFAAGVVVIVLSLAFARLSASERTVPVTLAGALAVHGALTLPDIRLFGTASALAAVALAPIMVDAWRRLPDGERRWWKRAGWSAAGFVVVSGLLAAVGGFLALGPINDAVASAETGIEALEQGQQEAAAELLASAESDFDRAAGTLGGPLLWPSRLVPIAAQHTRAIETAALQGRSLASAAVRTVTTADVDQIRGRNGALDLELVRSVATELGEAEVTVRNARASLADVRTPWLVSFLDDQLADVEAELGEVLLDVDLASEATTVVPQLLGGERPRTYLVLFIQPAELREFGGFVGGYGLLRADGGRLSLLESGSFGEDFGDGEARFTNGGDFPQSYFEKQPWIYPQNLTTIADLTTVAEAARDLTPQWRRDPAFAIDGVMTIDPFALAGLLQLTGPVEIPSRDGPLDASNVAEFLLRGQYLDGNDDLAQRRDALRELAAVAFAELLTVEIPGPERLGAIFGPLARQNRLTFTTFDEAERPFLQRVLLDADLPVADVDVAAIGVMGESAVAGKLDAYGTRHLRYVVDVDPATGETSGELTVTVGNESPADAPAYVAGLSGLDIGRDTWVSGDNVMALNVYASHELGEPRADHDFLTSENRLTFSYNRVQMTAVIPRDDERSIVIPTSGNSPPGRFDLLVMAQPTPFLTTFEIEVRVPDGWSISDPTGRTVVGRWTVGGDLLEHERISLTFSR